MNFENVVQLARYIENEIDGMSVTQLKLEGSKWTVTVHFIGINRPLIVSSREALTSAIRWCKRQVPTQQEMF